MAVNTIKFSEFVNGGIVNSSDTIVGLESGVNSYFAIATNFFDWFEVSANTTIAPNAGYISNSASVIELLLPPISAVGDEIAVSGLGVGGWKITQSANQYITISPLSTTIGTGGSLASTFYADSIRLVCTVANTRWSTSGGPQGILTIV